VSRDAFAETPDIWGPRTKPKSSPRSSWHKTPPRSSPGNFPPPLSSTSPPTPR